MKIVTHSRILLQHYNRKQQHYNTTTGKVRPSVLGRLGSYIVVWLLVIFSCLGTFKCDICLDGTFKADISLSAVFEHSRENAVLKFSLHVLLFFESPYILVWVSCMTSYYENN